MLHLVQRRLYEREADEGLVDEVFRLLSIAIRHFQRDDHERGVTRQEHVFVAGRGGAADGIQHGKLRVRRLPRPGSSPGR